MTTYLSRYIVALLLVTGLWELGLSQNFTDALRYSTTNPLNTARNASLGGAMGALGADFGVLSINPAGTGAYRSSEFVLGGAVFSTNTESELLDGGFPTTTENSSRFVITSFGMVFASRPKKKDPRKRKERKLKTSNFALGYNKTGEYGQNFNYAGRVLGSLTDRFAENALGVLPDDLSPFEEGLGYTTGAIYDFEGDLIYSTDYQLNPFAELLRRQTVETKGGSSEIFLSYGANWQEKLLFGVTLGVPFVNYEESKVYEEEDAATDEIPFFNALRFEESLQTSGSGFNAKFGVIYKPNYAISIGAAFNTGTRLNLTDNFETSFTYDYTDDYGERFVFTDISPQGSFNYALRTPWSVIGNFGAIIKKTAFIVAQIQYTDYSSARFDYSVKDNGNDFDDFEDAVNQDITQNLSGSIRMSIGGEYSWKKLRVRLGTIMDQSSFAEDNAFDMTYTAGLGVRFERVFFDFGYQYYNYEQGYLPYAVSTAPQPFVVNNVTNNRFFFTFGYKWL